MTESRVNDLVQRLTAPQPVELSLRPETDLAGFRAALDRGYVHVKFTETRGGTELGFEPTLDAANADLEAGTGEVGLSGELFLDDVPVRVHATIDLATLRGSGRLEPIESGAPAAASA